ncbi:hypothetical protein TYRP_004503 [Tyrophagus putrescentiae]|nr:hypothetical protein TYRP_004503 [Tyrophagus putrescentiae]
MDSERNNEVQAEVSGDGDGKHLTCERRLLLNYDGAMMALISGNIRLSPTADSFMHSLTADSSTAAAAVSIA